VPLAVTLIASLGRNGSLDRIRSPSERLARNGSAVVQARQPQRAIRRFYIRRYWQGRGAEHLVFAVSMVATQVLLVLQAVAQPISS
jgi:hypothetical protein